MFWIIEHNSVNDAVSLIYSLAVRFQELIETDDYSSADSLTPELCEIKEFDYYGVLSRLEILTDEWRRVLNSEENEPGNIDENDILLKNILIYFVYRYIPKAINDGNIISKAEFIIFSLGSVIRYAKRNQSAVSQKEKISYTARLYSKEIEHNRDNIETIINTI